jgi:hypothetical protein
MKKYEDEKKKKKLCFEINNQNEGLLNIKIIKICYKIQKTHLNPTNKLIKLLERVYKRIMKKEIKYLENEGIKINYKFIKENFYEIIKKENEETQKIKTLKKKIKKYEKEDPNKKEIKIIKYIINNLKERQNTSPEKKEKIKTRILQIIKLKDKLQTIKSIEKIINEPKKKAKKFKDLIQKQTQTRLKSELLVNQKIFLLTNKNSKYQIMKKIIEIKNNSMMKINVFEGYYIKIEMKKMGEWFESYEMYNYFYENKYKWNDQILIFLYFDFYKKLSKLNLLNYRNMKNYLINYNFIKNDENDNFIKENNFNKDKIEKYNFIKEKDKIEKKKLKKIEIKINETNNFEIIKEWKYMESFSILKKDFKNIEKIDYKEIDLIKKSIFLKNCLFLNHQLSKDQFIFWVFAFVKNLNDSQFTFLVNLKSILGNDFNLDFAYFLSLKFF